MRRWMWVGGAAMVLAACAGVEVVTAPGTTSEPTAQPASAPTSESTGPTSERTSEPTPAARSTRLAETERQLVALRVEARPAYADDYRRDAFGGRWADIDDNGCNQRDDVLLRDAVEAVTQPQGACNHDVVAGTWLDPYTGRTLTFDDLKDSSQAQAIQIDHVVPLAEAWRSGARGWPAHRRERFANDLANLLAADGPTNMSKGADDPAAWRPRKGYQCAYAQRWIAVKQRWDLAVDTSEVAALREMLGHC